MLIYIATNKINGKQYVGQTVKNLEYRKERHVYEALANIHNYYFHRAIRKYGPENFIWEILHDDVTNINELNKLEIFYIGYHNTYDNGYNLTKGGSGKIGWVPSEKTRKKMSEAQKGKKLPEKVKQKLSKINSGKNNPMYGVHLCGKDHHMYGKHFSEEAKRRSSESHKGQHEGKKNPAARAIIADNKHFDTTKEAAKFFGVSHTAIYQRLKKRLPGYRYINKKKEKK